MGLITFTWGMVQIISASPKVTTNKLVFLSSIVLPLVLITVYQ